MNEKKTIKIILSILLVIVIIMGIIIFKLYNEKTKEIKKSDELHVQINNLNETISNLQEETNNISEETNSNENITVNNEEVTYTITTRDEIYATIKATKGGKTVLKEFEMGGMIADTGTMELPTIGTVALVADSGGEYYGVSIYQLVNDEIKLIGTIDCGMDMVNEATYTVETKNEDTVIINAKRNDEIITKEFEMTAAIVGTSVVDILNCGKVVFVAESGGEYYGIQVYRLSQDYITGVTEEIRKVGSIQYDI